MRQELLDIFHANCKPVRLESLITVTWIHVVFLKIIEMKGFDL